MVGNPRNICRSFPGWRLCITLTFTLDVVSIATYRWREEEITDPWNDYNDTMAAYQKPVTDHWLRNYHAESIATACVVSCGDSGRFYATVCHQEGIYAPALL
jgi:hypothetical protein